MRRMTNFQYSFTRFLIIVLLGVMYYATAYIAISTYFHPDRRIVMVLMAITAALFTTLFAKYMPKRHYTTEV